MLSCWAYEASQRPTFSKIVVQMSDILTVAADYLDMSLSPSSVVFELKEQGNSLPSSFSLTPEQCEKEMEREEGGVELHPQARGGGYNEGLNHVLAGGGGEERSMQY